MEHIRIQTFGKFEITFNGEVYRLEKSQSTKTAHLLQFLTVNQGKSFEKSALVDILYEDGEVSDPLNNLKVNIFRLRQMLERSGLPGDKFILHRKGCYSWNPEITLNLDVDEFRRLLDHAARTDLPREDRIALMTAALDLYQGEFLPGLRGERWAEVIDTDCRQRYLDAVEFVDSYCCESDNFELEDRILRQAVSFFPYEEKVRAMQLRSLINRKMYREAMALYEEVTTRMMDDLGIVPSDELSRLHQILVSEIDMPITNFSDIRADMEDHDASAGAYNCSYVAFIDTARLISRYVQRNGQSAFLALCTLVDSHGAPLAAGGRLQDAAAAANRAVKESLRRGDLYTRYGPCQFLMLLIGINRENCQIVAKRIEDKFSRSPASRGVYFHWEFESTATLLPDEPMVTEEGRGAEASN
ncbi:MAG TPA: hypothetical protein IAC40_02090 [Candidatus Faecivivens stercorigallinarum]|nr:hypothetical protein [Candidatus Faecivivens stercorigallinarum]